MVGFGKFYKVGLMRLGIEGLVLGLRSVEGWGFRVSCSVIQDFAEPGFCWIHLLWSLGQFWLWGKP